MDRNQNLEPMTDPSDYRGADLERNNVKWMAAIERRGEGSRAGEDIHDKAFAQKSIYQSPPPPRGKIEHVRFRHDRISQRERERGLIATTRPTG